MVSFRTAVETLGILCECLDLREYAARMIHPLMRILDTAPELHTAAMNTLTAIVTQMGRDYLIFVPAVYKVGVIFFFFLQIAAQQSVQFYQSGFSFRSFLFFQLLRILSDILVKLLCFSLT